MGIKDLNYIWENPAFGLVRGLYVRPGKVYNRNYRPDEERRILFPRKVLKELEIQGSSSDLSKLLNGFLAITAPDNKLDFVKLEDMDNRLKNENSTNVNELFRTNGIEFSEKISHITPNDFQKAYKILMTLYDIVLGARYSDIEKACPGFAHYQYEKSVYPFKEAGSPSEMATWAFSQGAASELHSKPGKNRNMKALVSHEEDRITILSKEESDFSLEEAGLIW